MNSPRVGSGPQGPDMVDAKRKGIQSMEVGGRLLKVFGRHARPMLLGDVAREAGMAPSKAHPYLASFCKIQLIEQDPASGRYQLGALALRLGLAGLNQSPTFKCAAAMLEDLKEKVCLTTALAVWSSHGPMIVHVSDVGFPFQINLRVGAVMSMLETATGKVFAAYMPESMTRELIEAELGRLSDDAERRSAARQFALDVADVRRRGMGRAKGNPIPGVNALCVPVLDPVGNLALAVIATGNAEAFDAHWTGPVAQMLRQACEAVSSGMSEAAP